MTEEQYNHGERLQKRINEEMAKKQRIAAFLEQLEEKKIREKPGKTVEITCTEDRPRHEPSSNIAVDEERFENFLRDEIDQINRQIAELQDEFHSI